MTRLPTEPTQQLAQTVTQEAAPTQIEEPTTQQLGASYYAGLITNDVRVDNAASGGDMLRRSLQLAGVAAAACAAQAPTLPMCGARIASSSSAAAAVAATGLIAALPPVLPHCRWGGRASSSAHSLLFGCQWPAVTFACSRIYIMGKCHASRHMSMVYWPRQQTLRQRAVRNAALVDRTWRVGSLQSQPLTCELPGIC